MCYGKEFLEDKILKKKEKNAALCTSQSEDHEA